MIIAGLMIMMVRIVAALAYDLSVVVRNFSRTVIFEKRLKEDTSGAWDSASIDEFKHARSEGEQWKYSITRTFSDQREPTQTAIEPNTQLAMFKTFGSAGHLQSTEDAMQNFESNTESFRDVTVPIMDNLDLPEIGDNDDDNADAPTVFAV